MLPTAAGPGRPVDAGRAQIAAGCKANSARTARHEPYARSQKARAQSAGQRQHAEAVATDSPVSTRYTPAADHAPPSSQNVSHASGNGIAREDFSNGAGPLLDTPGHGVRVRISNLSKEFQTRQGRTLVVDNVDLEFPPNKVVALLGPSGSGKTTLLRIIAGLESTSSGRIMFDDVDATDMAVQDRRIGLVFQSYALFKHMTVAENIAFGPRVRKFDIDIDARVEELLELVELPGRGHVYPQQLSGGQRQRIALARALAVNPRLLLLDEPFGALDPQVRRSLRKGVRDIIDRVGVTSIIVTHDQEEAFDIADRVIIFNRGKVQQEGTPEEVQNHPNSPFTLYFTDVDVNRLPSACQFVRRMGLRTHKPFVMFRPRAVRLCNLPPEQALPSGFVPATVRDLIDLGPKLKSYLRFDDGEEIEMHLNGWAGSREPELELQQRVYVRVDPSDFMPYLPEEIASR